MKKIIATALVGLAAAAGVTGCSSQADTVSDNLSKDAEQFKITRKIVGINGITDKPLFSVTGRCSLETSGSLDNTLDVICKVGPGKGQYTKDYLGLSDNVTFVSTQVKPSTVDPYHHEVILRPTTVVPNFKVDTP